MAFDANIDYAEACNPDRWSILGLRLLPFCEGHKQNLRRIGSPFVCGGKINGESLFTAAVICSMTYEAGQNFVASRGSIWLKFRLLLVALMERISPVFVQARAEALTAYMDEAEKLPKGIFRSPLKEDGKPHEMTYAPSALVFESDLANHYHLSPSEVMNMPLRKATFLRYRLLESDRVLRWRPSYYDSAPQKTEALSGN